MELADSIAQKEASPKSYDIGKAALNLQWRERVARYEFMSRREIVHHFSGRDPKTRPRGYGCIQCSYVPYAIQAFGWEMLLTAAGENLEHFGEQVLGSIFERSLHLTMPPKTPSAEEEKSATR